METDCRLVGGGIADLVQPDVVAHEGHRSRGVDTGAAFAYLVALRINPINSFPDATPQHFQEAASRWMIVYLALSVRAPAQQQQRVVGPVRVDEIPRVGQGVVAVNVLGHLAIGQSHSVHQVEELVFGVHLHRALKLHWTALEDRPQLVDCTWYRAQRRGATRRRLFADIPTTE